MTATCQFSLSKGNLPYFTGEGLSGTVVFTTKEEKIVKNISIIFTGGAKVRFRNIETKRRHFERKSSTASTVGDDFVARDTFVYKAQNLRKEGVLPAGTYEYPFNFIIPVQGETSFESACGQVRYELTFKIYNPDNSDTVFKKPLTVLKILDLNSSPHYKAPQSCIVSSTSWCVLLTRQMMFYSLQTCMSAYVPGQMMKYSLEIVNKSSEKYENFLIDLIKVVTYTARYPCVRQKRCKTILLSKFIADQDFGDQVYSGHFNIPATPPTTSHTNLIYIEYFLKVTIQLPFFNSKLEVQIPVIIGSTPVRDSVPMSAKVLVEEPMEGFQGALSKVHHEITPPAYRNSLPTEGPFIDLDLDEKHRFTNFYPVYPVYEMLSAKRTFHRSQ